MSYQPGQVLLGEYRMEELIGVGSFGEVYRVTYLPLNQVRALKILRREGGGLSAREIEAAEQRFRREYWLGGQLNSPKPDPHLLLVYEPVLAEDLLGVVLEYAPAGNLKERIERANQAGEVLALETCLRIARDVALGLGRLHQLNIVHRDIKPANILFDQDDRARVGDLGLVQTEDDMTERLQKSNPAPHPGTPGYKSPEQVESLEPLKTSSDVYVLGLVLFEMLTGRKYALQRAGIRARELRTDLPAEVDTLLARLLAKNPDDRPNDGREAAGLLDKMFQKYKNGGSFFAKKWNGLAMGAVFLSLIVPILVYAVNRNSVISAPVYLTTVVASATVPNLVVPPAPSVSASTQTKQVTLTYGKTSTKVATITPIPSTQPVTRTSMPMRTVAVSTQPKQVTKTFVQTPTKFAIKTLLPSIQPVTHTPVSTPTWTPIVRVRLNTDKMLMIKVPAGLYTMGSMQGADDEKPVHTFFLADYWIDQTEITNDMFARFVQAAIYKTSAEVAGTSWVFNLKTNNWESISGANWRQPFGPAGGQKWMGAQPVVQVSWEDAVAYCTWAGARLPTEAEWEKAARGTQGATYPWGEAAPASDLLNFADLSLAVNWADKNVNDGYQFTAPVRSYPRGVSPYGALDMAGNVWEWTADWYQPYPGNHKSNAEYGEKSRVLRGGSWTSNSPFTRVSERNPYRPLAASSEAGFRCAGDTNMPTKVPPTSTATPTASITPTPTEPPGKITEHEAEMGLVPGGIFMMGSSHGDPDEKPQHPVIMSAYYMDVNEVTNGLYQACVKAGDCSAPTDISSFYTRTSYYGNPEFDHYPVINVSWEQSQTYCDWRGARLPTEAEWEYAARGMDMRIYPWGKTIDTGYANYAESQDENTSVVGFYEKGKSPFGMNDMAGNVWEWTADWYQPYPGNMAGSPAYGESYRVIRGGSWSYLAEYLRTSNRYWTKPEESHFYLGFRCARNVVP
jgi:formylglycine-generating enzyme required for sulfatase activity